MEQDKEQVLSIGKHPSLMKVIKQVNKYIPVHIFIHKKLRKLHESLIANELCSFL